MAFLQVIDGPHISAKYEVAQSTNVIGRHPDCQIVLEVGAVSRKHAQILYQEDKFLLEDLLSRNHTFLNDNDIFEKGPVDLNDGDSVRICDVTFRFSSSGESPAEEAEDATVDASQVSALFVDDEGSEATATIMSKVDIASFQGRAQFVSSPEAKLKALLEITSSLGKALSLEEVLPNVLSSLFKIFMQADRGFLGLKNDQGVLVPRWTKARRADAEDTIRVSRTIVNQVMDSQEAILSADAATDERFNMSQSIADFRIRSMMCAPLIDSDGKSMGVIQVDTLDQSKRFQQDDLDVLASVATQAGIAIDNAQMHEKALLQQALERDLQLANDVQTGFLPSNPPELSEYEFYQYYHPANHVGGDYYDYIQLSDERIAVIVADVVGHGVAAALMMAKLSAETRFALASQPNLSAAINQLNDSLSAIATDRFVTLIAVLLDPNTHTATMVNAGHMSPMHRHADGSVDEPIEEEADLPLGVMEGVEYEQVEVTLQAGDTLTMYTDGINEAMNSSDDEYGMDAIRKLAQEKDTSAQELGETIIADVRQFIGKSAQFDDMCLVCLRRKGSPA